MQPMGHGSDGVAGLDGLMDRFPPEAIGVLLDNVSDVILWYDRGGILLWASPSLERVFGWRPADVIGTPFRAGSPEVQAQEDRVMVDAARRQRAEQAYRTSVQCPDGSVRAADAAVRFVRAENGSVDSIVVVVRDTTAEAEADEALARSERRYRTYAENSSDVVYECDREGTLQWVSPSVHDVLGWQPEQVRGMRAAELVHADDYDVLRSLRGRVLAGTDHADAVVRCRDAGGSFLQMLVRARSVVDDDGNVTGLVGGVRDVDELIRSRQEADANRRMLQATLDSLMDPHVVLMAVRAPDGTIVDFEYSAANTAACEYLRRTHDELIGTRLLRLLPGHSGALLLDRFVHVIQTGEPMVLDDFSDSLALFGGRQRWHDVRAVRMGDAISCAWRDVTDRHADAAALAASERRYRLIAENASDVVFLFDADGVVQWVSPSVTDLLGWRVDEFIGVTPGDLVHPDDLSRVNEIRQGVGVGDAAEDDVCRLRCADGSYRYLSVSARPVLDAEGNVTGGVTSLRDVDDLVRSRRAAEESETKYRLLAEYSSDLVFQSVPDGQMQWLSPSVADVLGWSPEELVGKNFTDFVNPDDLPAAQKALKSARTNTAYNYQARFLTKGGAYRWFDVTACPVAGDDGTVRSIVGGARDIEAEVIARAALEHALRHDPLTGLATHAAVSARLETLLARAVPGRREVGVLCAGVDGLGDVVSALTHSGGDQILATAAARIVEAVGDPDLVGRGSGNEYFVLVPELASAADAGMMARMMREEVRSPITVGGQKLDLSIGVGIATGRRGDDPERLLLDATLARQQAMASGRDRDAFADPALAVEAGKRLSTEAAIRQGLQAGRFVPWYQPVVALPSGETVGYEALVRWLREDGSVTSPADYFPVAEASGLVVEIDLTVLEQAVAALAKLPAPITIAVNASAASLANPDYARAVTGALARYGVDPARLHLEVVETTLVTLDGQVQSTIIELAELGIPWYVDDFGTGYSSISHLRDLPVTGLKLDQSFTAELPTGAKSRQLAAALAGIAANLRLDTVAEGVETRQQATLLAAQGWVHAQGWLFGRPTPLNP